MYAPELHGACRGRRLTVRSVAPKGKGHAPATVELLTAAFLSERIAEARTRLLAARDEKKARRALDDLTDLLGGETVVARLVGDLLPRHLPHVEFLEELHDALGGTPELSMARRRALGGDVEGLGLLALAFGGRDEDDDPAKWRQVVAMLLRPGRVAGTDISARSPLLRSQLTNLVERPFDADRHTATLRDGVLHSSDDTIAPGLRAWLPVLRAAIALQHADPEFGKGGDVWGLDLSIEEREFGGAPSPSGRFVEAELDRLRWQQIQPLLRAGWALCGEDLDWLSVVEKTANRPALAAALGRLLETAPDDERRYSLLECIPNDLRARLAPRLLPLLSSSDDAVRARALALLPAAAQRQLPPAILRAVFEAAGEVDFALLGRRPDGMALLRGWLFAGHEFAQSYEAVQRLGARRMHGLPLATLAELTFDDTRATVAAVLAHDRHPVAALQASLRKHADPTWRLCVLHHLHARGVKDSGLDPKDPAARPFQRLFATLRGDVEAREEVRSQLHADRRFRTAKRGPKRRKQDELPKWLRRAYAVALAPHMTPAELGAWWRVLPTSPRRAALRGLDLDVWHRLLARQPIPWADLEVIPKSTLDQLGDRWRVALRRAEEFPHEAARRLATTSAGAAALRALALDPKAPASHRAAAARAVFAAIATPTPYLRPDLSRTRWAPSNTYGSAVRLREAGWGGTWTAAERATRATLLRRLGVPDRPERR